ncbi:hypothetical protein ACINWC323_1318 [Acinetobacter sp. WC-323]|uniref:hypothetical protein n=1 Tax=Acinetobacter sp. WC-323 TaxID=903918 RepID=UPI00029E588C|nr:hypothetical protein [Acinetobacter sp. WC-323]EKU55894.1 hypothetical protein ACINWC323_1318 [Acinetobacter sp. WC-323]
MSNYLAFAENIYEQCLTKNYFNQDPRKYLNKLLGEIQHELKETEIKLTYNYFDEDFADRKFLPTGFDLIPNYENKTEYLLWLASFIEKNSTGGKRSIPAIKNDIPCDQTFSNTFSKIALQKIASGRSKYSNIRI